MVDAYELSVKFCQPWLAGIVEYQDCIDHDGGWWLEVMLILVYLRKRLSQSLALRNTTINAICCFERNPEYLPWFPSLKYRQIRLCWWEAETFRLPPTELWGSSKTPPSYNGNDHIIIL